MISELIIGSKIIVCPYTDATQSGVVMTAHCFNKPIVASDVGGFNEVIQNGKTGFLVPPHNPIDLANCIEKFLNNELLIEDVMSNINKFHNNSAFSWNSIATKVIHIYNSL